MNRCKFLALAALAPQAAPAAARDYTELTEQLDGAFSVLEAKKRHFEEYRKRKSR